MAIPQLADGLPTRVGSAHLECQNSKYKQEGQEFKVILHYTEMSGPAEATEALT